MLSPYVLVDKAEHLVCGLAKHWRQTASAGVRCWSRRLRWRGARIHAGLGTRCGDRNRFCEQEIALPVVIDRWESGGPPDVMFKVLARRDYLDSLHRDVCGHKINGTSMCGGVPLIL
jgi:hypothetical protein